MDDGGTVERIISGVEMKYILAVLTLPILLPSLAIGLLGGIIYNGIYAGFKIIEELYDEI
ncbi:MAG: hypothetical protein GWP19_05000 [Planctomycetia bacterium]|nr:hypothetical protein [Planctomycetia bacterium]